MADANGPRAVLGYLEEALAADPLCYEALVMAGDIWSLDQEELGVEVDEGSRIAVSFYNRAIAAQPDVAEAYAEKGRTLTCLERWEDALACLEGGLARFDVRPNTDLPK